MSVLDPGHPYAGDRPVPTFTPRHRVQEPRILAARTDSDAIEHALAGVRGIDFAAVDAAKAVPGLTHAAVRSAVAGAVPRTGPQAVPPPAAAGPSAPSPAALLRDEMARYRLAEIVFAAARNAEPPYGPYCPDCKTSSTGWCEPCDRARERSEALDRLHDLILAADTYATAAVLVARTTTEGGAR